MSRLVKVAGVVLITALTLFAGQPGMDPPPASGQKWEVYELSFVDSTSYQNPFWDVNISAAFTSPGGTTLTVRGFYYDTDLWKVRFAPTEAGQWTFHVSYMRPQDTTTFDGSFTAADAQSHGFIRVDPSYPGMFSYSDGTVFFPIGTNGHTPAITGVFLGIQAGAQQVPSMWDTLAAYGVNTYRLFMFNQDAFADSFSWNTDEGMANLVYHTGSLDRYDLRTGKLVDRWFREALDHNINIYLNMFVLFDINAYPFSSSPWAQSNGGPFASENDVYASATGPGAELEKKYYTYIVDRWGAYRNIFAWEYNNEYGYYSAPSWIAMVDSVVSANDPYGRPHSVSFWNYSFSSTSPVDTYPGVDITDDHLYASSGWDEFDIDSAANAQSLARRAAYHKPVMFGEFGSGDSDSPRWMHFLRAGYWAAFLSQGYPILWMVQDNNPTGWDYNLKSLGILRAAVELIHSVRSPYSLRPANEAAETDSPGVFRTYCMKGDSDVVVYVRDIGSDLTEVTGLSLKLELPGIAGKTWTAVWLDPASGDSIATASGTSESDTLVVQTVPFMADALLHLYMPGTPTGVRTTSLAIPAASSLQQNYPNPFNPTTAIRYKLSAASYVTLKIYDILGREVATLMHGRQNPGSYTVTLDGRNLASGVYFYRLVAEGKSGERFVSTKKLVLMR